MCFKPVVTSTLIATYTHTHTYIEHMKLNFSMFHNIEVDVNKVVKSTEQRKIKIDIHSMKLCFQNIEKALFLPHYHFRAGRLQYERHAHITENIHKRCVIWCITKNCHYVKAIKYTNSPSNLCFRVESALNHMAKYVVFVCVCVCLAHHTTLKTFGSSGNLFFEFNLLHKLCVFFIVSIFDDWEWEHSSACDDVVSAFHRSKVCRLFATAQQLTHTQTQRQTIQNLINKTKSHINFAFIANEWYEQFYVKPHFHFTHLIPINSQLLVIMAKGSYLPYTLLCFQL